MKIGIDAHFVTRLPRRGIGTYSLNLIRELVLSYSEHDFYLYIRYPDLEGVLPSGANVFIRLLSAPLDPIWEQVVLPFVARRDGVDILHSLGNTGPIFISRDIRHVLSLMDVMFLKSEKYLPKPVNMYQRIGRSYRSIVSPRCARSADSVITISNYSKHDIVQSIQGLDSSRIEVTHLACDSGFLSNDDLGNSKDHSPSVSIRGDNFILCLGADDPRKNTLRIIQAFLLMINKSLLDINLLVVGYKNWKKSLAFKEVVNAGAESRIEFRSFVPTAELVSLYRNATLFIYPSLYEGFGIPILEAFSSGCPVVASNTSSIPEIASNAALYVDPENVDEMAAAMLNLICDEDLRILLRARGLARSSEFGWKRVASQTMDVYRRVLC